MMLAYKDLLVSDRDYLMLQQQSYAACDEIVRGRVRHRYAQLVDLVRELSGAETERLDEFFRRGMALNVAAVLGVEELSVDCPWIQSELDSAVPCLIDSIPGQRPH
jgi:hypothetical protein